MQLVESLPYSTGDLSSIPTSGASYVESDCVGYVWWLWFRPTFKNVQVGRLIGYPKLPAVCRRVIESRESW